MKKSFFIFVLSLIFTCVLFAENAPGTSKLGIYLGYPAGISFSHNFTRKDQLDISAAYTLGFPGSYLFQGLDLYIGYLRSIYEPNVGGAICPLEIGGGLGTAVVQEQTYPNNGRNMAAYLGVFLDLRWEVFFKNAPKFNLFFDIAPGVFFNFTANKYNRYLALFTGRGGIGFRYVF